MVAESSSFLCKNEELCILHFDIRPPVSVKNHSFQHHNDGKKVYLDKVSLYDYNYVHSYIDTKLQIQVTKIRRYGYGYKIFMLQKLIYTYLMMLPSTPEVFLPL